MEYGLQICCKQYLLGSTTTFFWFQKKFLSAKVFKPGGYYPKNDIFVENWSFWNMVFKFVVNSTIQVVLPPFFGFKMNFGKQENLKLRVTTPRNDKHGQRIFV